MGMALVTQHIMNTYGKEDKVDALLATKGEI